MRLKNRFKNRFVSHQKWVEWFSARDFKSGVVACLANPHFRDNWRYTIVQHLTKDQSWQIQTT